MASAEVAVAFHSAAAALQHLGRRALEAAADNSADLLHRTARALQRAADILLDQTDDDPDRRAAALTQARASIIALAERVPSPSAMYVSYGREALETYWRSLGQHISRAAREGQRWPKRRRRDRAPDRGSESSSRSSGATRRAERRFLVQEVTSWIGYTGSVWAVSCTSRQQALRSLDWRVLRNLFDEGEPGNVLIFDRRTRRVVAWTNNAAKNWYSSRGVQQPIGGVSDVE